MSELVGLNGWLPTIAVRVYGPDDLVEAECFCGRWTGKFANDSWKTAVNDAVMSEHAARCPRRPAWSFA